ncbi:MAG: metallophosphoesterase [Flavisolibacter sp.]
MLVLDFYVFQIIKVLAQSAGSRTKSILFTSYWSVSIIALLILFILPLLNLDNYAKGVRSTLFAIIIGLFLAKLIACVFFLLDDMRRAIQWIVGKIFFKNTEGEQMEGEQGISRSVFLSWLGVGVGGVLYTALVYGFTNKYNYVIRTVNLNFQKLPQAFKGLKIVQISDIHSGSFTNKAAVEKGVEKAMELGADLILFTGDLVNNEAGEMTDYIEVFAKLQAPMGVFSTLGNHDYGDYHKWPDLQSKNLNLENLKGVHARMGWKLLMDEHVLLEKKGQQIALIGIQNWSALKRFPKYGNLKKAYEGTENIPFKILMSHDPTHWDAEVRPSYKDIDLTLAGHTHGMQFGIELPGFRWSPVEYVYRQWAGLYQEGNQTLYVNRGYGFIGYPGRVGILPEITLFELS